MSGAWELGQHCMVILWNKNASDVSVSFAFCSLKQKNSTIERWTKFTKQLLIASSGHQVPRKAAHCFQREVGQNIKDKKGDKRAIDGYPSWEGSLNRGIFQSAGNPHAGGSGGSFQISEGNLTGRKNQIRLTDYMPKSNSQQKSTPDARTRHQQVGAERRGAGGIA